jgi:hypothetical protein
VESSALIDFLKKERTRHEKTTYSSRETLHGEASRAQPQAHLTAPGVLQVAEEKPAWGLCETEKKSGTGENRPTKKLKLDAFFQ